MKQLLWHYSLACCLLLVAATGQAAYITDRLVAGLYSEADITTDPIKALASGTPLQIIERQKGYSKVRLGDNTEGWVENRYINEEKPARVMLLELQAKNSDLHNQLITARADLKQEAKAHTDSQPDTADQRGAEPQLEEQLSRAQGNIQSLQQQLQGAEQTATESAQLIESLQQQLSELKAHPEEPIGPATQSVELTYWHYLAIALLLLLSFIGGILFKKRRISRRYGGLRV